MKRLVGKQKLRIPMPLSRSFPTLAPQLQFSDEGYDLSSHPLQRILQRYGLGRLKRVCEITAGITWNNDLPGGCGMYASETASSNRAAIYPAQGNVAVSHLTDMTGLTIETYPEGWGNTLYYYNSAGDRYQRVRPNWPQFGPNPNIDLTLKIFSRCV